MLSAVAEGQLHRFPSQAPVLQVALHPRVPLPYLHANKIGPGNGESSTSQQAPHVGTSPRPAGLLFFSNSDDHLLKNIELFDKLSLRFNGRVLFIKDVIGDEICCWSFYGQGRKLAEVCCTSIVYATEKKQTKVCTGFPLPGDRPHRLQDGALALPQCTVPTATEESHVLSKMWYDGTR